MVQRDTYVYENWGQGYSDYVFTEQYLKGYYPSIVWGYDLFQSRYSYISSYVQTAHTTYSYKDNGTFTTNESLSHNEYGLVTTRSLTGPQNITTTYTYPLSTDASPISQQLVNRHMMSTILESRTVTHSSGTFDVIGYKKDYDIFDGRIYPFTLYKLSISNGIGSNYEEEQQVLSYTSNGCPCEIVDRSGIHTVYIWGHSDRYLLAEIKNATLLQVQAASQSGSNIRDALPNSLVTTWTHSPMVGITSQTDPSGVSTYYNYDSLGRLSEVYRYAGNVVSPSNKQILKRYTYYTKTH
jgi:YD repeat-containing protein